MSAWCYERPGRVWGVDNPILRGIISTIERKTRGADTMAELNATFVWLEAFNVATFGKSNYASAWAKWPFYIFDEPWIQYDQEAPDKVRVEAGTVVWVWPEVFLVTYPIGLWIEFWAPNQVTYGATNFHYWWIEPGR
jgi:hypothetical protein